MKPSVSRAFALLCISAFLTVAQAQPVATPSSTCQVYFSPGGEATSAILQALNNAKSTVLVQAYSFTSAPIAEALVKAHRRGVNVQIILDKSQRTQKYSSADFLVNSGIPTRIDAAHAIAHNKVIIIDGGIVITGSFNFTKAAEERNAENLLIIHSSHLARLYTQNWQLHERHSEPYRWKTSSHQLSGSHADPCLPTTDVEGSLEKADIESRKHRFDRSNVRLTRNPAVTRVLQFKEEHSVHLPFLATFDLE
ncbi:MAG: phospholipase D family protein [Ignavibacteriales bacterium]|nr:phospholipase D family protein [Ignavibacteriales bacterium]